MNTTGWIWALVAVIIIVGGAWWYISSNNQAAPAQTTGTLTGTVATSSDNGMPDTGVSGTPTSVTVTYDGNTFSPSTVTVSKGGTVNFVDNSGTMWVASDPHPAHSSYDGTSRTTHCAAGYTGAAPLDECSSGSNFSFTFNKTGSFGYHDHLNDSAQGTVVVQ